MFLHSACLHGIKNEYTVMVVPNSDSSVLEEMSWLKMYIATFFFSHILTRRISYFIKKTHFNCYITLSTDTQ